MKIEGGKSHPITCHGIIIFILYFREIKNVHDILYILELKKNLLLIDSFIDKDFMA